MKIAFLHPDLGIGGAERLVVDAAVAFQQKGHEVTMFTSHHGVKAFDETKDGTLEVVVHGDFLPRTIFDRFYIFFAIIRAMYLAFVVGIKYNHYDVIFCDQNAAYIPILRLFTKAKILFYCHHPDYVQTSHSGILKKIYRAPFDLFEEYCISMADSVLVNSLYTQSIYKKSFKMITAMESIPPEVVYPAVDYSSIRKAALADSQLPQELNNCKYFISVNRYERKKGIEKAILGFARLRSKLGENVYEREKLRLVIVGGYDPRLTENVEYYDELNNLAMVCIHSTVCGPIKPGKKTILAMTCHSLIHHYISEEVADYVIFIRNCAQDLKARLIQNSIALIYTPTNEHFGIVPLEAMALGRPVIADNSGGPMETVIPSVNGFLCNSWEEFGDAMRKIVTGEVNADVLGNAGKKRVEEKFSFETFANQLNECAMKMEKRVKLQLYIPIVIVAIVVYVIARRFA